MAQNVKLEDLSRSPLSPCLATVLDRDMCPCHEWRMNAWLARGSERIEGSVPSSGVLIMAPMRVCHNSKQLSFRASPKIVGETRGTTGSPP
jgi:hypothetical protein